MCAIFWNVSIFRLLRFNYTCIRSTTFHIQSIKSHTGNVHCFDFQCSSFSDTIVKICKKKYGTHLRKFLSHSQSFTRRRSQKKKSCSSGLLCLLRQHLWIQADVRIASMIVFFQTLATFRPSGNKEKQNKNFETYGHNKIQIIASVSVEPLFNNSLAFGYYSNLKNMFNFFL